MAARSARALHGLNYRCFLKAFNGVKRSTQSFRSVSVTSQHEAGRSACWVMEGRRQDTHTHTGTGGGSVLWAALAFSLFKSSEEVEREEALQKKEDMILLLKKAKLSISRDQLQQASGFLHQAVALAHQTHNHQAIIYTYSMMANLAYVQGQLDHAEKLFKAAMSFMLRGGTPENDNAVIEISLKLATIYAEQNKVELAEHGFRFCTESLEEKLEKQKQQQQQQEEEEGKEHILTEEQQTLHKDTRLLLGLCLDSRARYRASTQRLKLAAEDYQKALDICRQVQGDTHPQTLVLMSDLATILDLQGCHDDALAVMQQAVSQSEGSEDRHVLLANMAGILMHTGQMEKSFDLYQEALVLCLENGDSETEEQIKQGLTELEERRDKLKTDGEGEGEKEGEREGEKDGQKDGGKEDANREDNEEKKQENQAN